MRVYCIQYLRCVAMTLTILIHLLPQLERLGVREGLLLYLPSGVDMFFIISGFIMWVTTYGRDHAPLSFLYRRLSRIVPLYWLVTAFMVAVMLLAPSALQSGRFELNHAILSFLFFPAHHPVTGLMEPVLVPGWTLNYEFFFYLIFSLALLLPPKPRLISVLCLLVGLVCVQFADPPDPSVISFYTSSVLLEFAAGLLVGAAWLQGKALPRRIATPAIVLGFLLLIGLTPLQHSLPRSVVWGLPSLLVILGALSIEKAGTLRKYWILGILGDASYSVYLSHAITLSAVTQAWRLAGLGGSTLELIVFSLLSIAASLIGGLLVYRLVERPLIRVFRPKKQRDAASAAVPVR